MSFKCKVYTESFIYLNTYLYLKKIFKKARKLEENRKCLHVAVILLSTKIFDALKLSLQLSSYLKDLQLN